jgi:hypothetical protein
MMDAGEFTRALQLFSNSSWEVIVANLYSLSREPGRYPPMLRKAYIEFLAVTLMKKVNAPDFLMLPPESV